VLDTEDVLHRAKKKSKTNGKSSSKRKSLQEKNEKARLSKFRAWVDAKAAADEASPMEEDAKEA
jgi:hypothetical protein